MAAPHAKGNWRCWSQGSAPDSPGLTWLSAKEASLFRARTGYHLHWVTWPELKFECKSLASHKHYPSFSLTMHEDGYKIFKKWDSERSLLPLPAVITPSPSSDIRAPGLRPTHLFFANGPGDSEAQTGTTVRWQKLETSQVNLQGTVATI